MFAPRSFTRMRAQSRGKKNDFSSDKVYQPLVVTLGELSCKRHIFFFILTITFNQFVLCKICPCFFSFSVPALNPEWCKERSLGI